MGRLRIVRTASGAYAPPAGVSPPDQKTWQRLQALIARSISPATATILAEPVASSDGAHIDWFTQLAGQPVRLGSLPSSERQRARRLLDDRIRAMRELAGTLRQSDAGVDWAATLLQATTYPGEETIYVIDGQPVITFWGYGMLPKEEPAAAPAPAPRRAAWPWMLALGLTLAGGLGWAAVHYSWLRWPPWGPDYAAMLAAERMEGERLRRLLADLQRDLARTLGRCALQAQFDALNQERALLVSTLETLQARLRDELKRCGLKAVETEGIDLWAKLTDLRRALAEAREKCAAPVEEKKVDKTDKAAEERRAERERLRHVQVDGTLGCTGRSSRLFFKVPFDLGGGRFSVNFRGKDYDGSSVSSRIDATYDPSSQRMVLDLQTMDVGPAGKAMRVDRCEGTWRGGTFYDPRCKLVRTSGQGRFCDPLWLRIKTKTKLGK